MSVGALGVWLERHVLGLPIPFGDFAAAFVEHTQPPGARAADGQRLRDLMPLPLPGVSPPPAPCTSGKARQRAQHRREREAWVRLAVLALNYGYCAGGSSRPTALAHASEPTPAQQEALRHIGICVSRFLGEAGGDRLTLADVRSQLAARTCNYDGSPAVVARTLRFEALLPGLPAPGTGGHIEVSEVVTPATRRLLLDPVSLLLPRDEWPAVPPRASVMAGEAEWHKVAGHMVRAGLWEPIARSDIFAVDGAPVVAGVMAVDKGWDEGRQLQLQRLIVNLVPQNSYQRRITHAAGELPFVTQTSLLVLPRHEVVYISSEDQASCFNQYRLPPCWRPYMALGRPVPGEVLGIDQREVWLTVAVVPMGWLSAADLMQEVCREINVRRSGLGTAGELRPGMPFPAGPVVHQTYLDNFDALEVVRRGEAAAFEGSAGGPGDAVRAAGEAVGVIYNDTSKRKVRAPGGELLGAVLCGTSGRIGVHPAKLRWLAYAGAALLSQRVPSERGVLNWLGRFGFACQFRRPAWAWVERLYGYAGRGRWRPWTPAVASELLSCIGVLPFLFADLRGEVLPLIVCTDASPTGCGATRARAASSAAVRELLRFADHRGADVHLSSGTVEEPRRRVPRESFDTSGYEWDVVLSFRWRQPDHINILEVRAWFAYLRAHVRSQRHVRTRWAHVFDSLVALGVAAKGRSSSRKLNAVVRRGNAIVLAAGLAPFYLWTASESNPADAPSRRAA